MPYKYVAQRPDGRKDTLVIHVKDDLPSAKVTNISGTSGMTGSGRIFVAPELPVRSKDKGKAKVDLGENDKAGLTPNDEVTIGKIVEEGASEWLSQSTLQREGDVRLTGASSKERKHTESPPTFI